MSRLTDLIAQVKAKDPQMGLDLESEFKALSKRRAFGLNFERHKPEEVELPGRPIRRGDKVRIFPERGATGPGDQRLWIVNRTERVDGKRVAHLRLPSEQNPEEQVALVDDLVVVAAFGDAIYPGLVETGRVERGGADTPFHTVINAENYHALRTLTYTHRGKIDCIYIDPPYNTGDKSWKYNNNYVEKDDLYRHSKWLAFVERRLKIARELLNPDDSVLIVTIDEKEYLRLGMLLEQTFPEARIQMVSSVINPGGASRTAAFTRVDEYIYFVKIGAASPIKHTNDMLFTNAVDREGKRSPIWRGMLRGGSGPLREDSPSKFYPVLVDDSGAVVGAGAPLGLSEARDSYSPPPGLTAIWPLKKGGVEGRWELNATTFEQRRSLGYVRAGEVNKRTGLRTIYYLRNAEMERLESGELISRGMTEQGYLDLEYNPDVDRSLPAKTVWNMESHNATEQGSNLLKKMVPGRRFPYPKSLYAVEDTLRFFLANKPTATVLDFFAGSGTTAHAVMRLNRQDDGRRQCISVTNNEVSAGEQSTLRKRGLRPGDLDWESQGICDYITKPRIEAAITGKNYKGVRFGEEYKFTDLFPMAEGFKANARFFTLTYETPISVSHNRAYARIAPLLWLRAGAQGREISTLPEAGWEIADTYALLHDLDTEGAFLEALEQARGLRIAFIVTDDAGRFESVSSRLPKDIEPVRLYESYLTNLAFLSGD